MYITNLKLVYPTFAFTSYNAIFFIIDIVHCIFFFNDCITQWLEKDNRMSRGMLTIHMLEHHGGSHYILPSKKSWLYFMMCHMFKLQPMQGILNQHPRYFVPLLAKDFLCKTYAPIRTLFNRTFYGIISSRSSGSKHDTLPPQINQVFIISFLMHAYLSLNLLQN